MNAQAASSGAKVHLQYKACSWRCCGMTAAVMRHGLRQHCPGAVLPYAAAALLGELCCDGTAAVLHQPSCCSAAVLRHDSFSAVQLQCCDTTATVLRFDSCSAAT